MIQFDQKRSVEKVRAENDVGLVKEVIELGSDIASTLIPNIVRERDQNHFEDKSCKIKSYDLTTIALFLNI